MQSRAGEKAGRGPMCRRVVGGCVLSWSSRPSPYNPSRRQHRCGPWANRQQLRSVCKVTQNLPVLQGIRCLKPPLGLLPFSSAQILSLCPQLRFHVLPALPTNPPSALPFLSSTSLFTLQTRGRSKDDLIIRLDDRPCLKISKWYS